MAFDFSKQNASKHVSIRKSLKPYIIESLNKLFKDNYEYNHVEYKMLNDDLDYSLILSADVGKSLWDSKFVTPYDVSPISIEYITDNSEYVWMEMPISVINDCMDINPLMRYISFDFTVGYKNEVSRQFFWPSWIKKEDIGLSTYMKTHDLFIVINGLSLNMKDIYKTCDNINKLHFFNVKKICVLLKPENLDQVEEIQQMLLINQKFLGVYQIKNEGYLFVYEIPVFRPDIEILDAADKEAYSERDEILETYGNYVKASMPTYLVTEDSDIITIEDPELKLMQEYIKERY